VVLRLLLVSVFVPGLIAGVVAAAARLLPETSRLRRGAPLVALGAGYVAAHLAAVGAPSFPPVDTTQGLFYLALVACALGVAAVGGTVWVRRGAAVAAIGSMLGLTLHPLVRHQWSRSASIGGVVALSLGAVVLWWAYGLVAARLSVTEVRAGWIAAFASTGLLLVFARTALLAQLASTIAVSSLVVALVAPPAIGADASDAAALPFLAPMLHALVLNGLFYAELGASAAIVLALAPLAAAVALTVARRGATIRVAAATLGVVVLLAPFAARGAIAYLADDRGYHEYDE
jgi:hypothetical protein